MPAQTVSPAPRRRVDPALIVTLIVGCIAGGFVVRYAAKTIPNRAVGGLAAGIAGDVKVSETPAFTLQAVGDVRGVGFAGDDGVFVGDRDGLTRRDLKTGKIAQTFDTDGNGVRSLAASPDGAAVVAALSYSGEVRLFGATDPKPALTFKSATDQEQQAVAFAPDGKAVAAGGFDKTVRVYRAGDAVQAAGKAGAVFDTTKNSGTSGKLVSAAIKEKDTISTVAFSPDGKTIAAGTGPKTVCYSVETGKATQTFYADKSATTAGAFAPDGKTVAVGTADGAVFVFEVATGRQVSRLDAVMDTGKNANVFAMGATGVGVVGLGFAPDGKTIVAAYKGGVVAKSDIATGKPLQLYAEPDTPGAQSLAVSTDGKRAVVGYTDGSVRVWNL